MMSSRRRFCQWFVASLTGSAVFRAEDKPVSFQVVDDWTVKVIVPDAGIAGVVHVNPPVMVRVTAEEYKAIPVFNPNTGGWLRGAQLRGVKAQQTTSPRLLEPDSHAALRIDAVVLTADGQIRIRQGQPRAAAPAFPQAAAGESLVGNIYLSGFIRRLGPDEMFPCWNTLRPKGLQTQNRRPSNESHVVYAAISLCAFSRGATA